MRAANGVGNLRNVDGTLGVDGDAVGGDELSGALPFVHVAELADQTALQVEDRNTVSQAGGVINAAHAVQLADVDVLAPEDHGVWPVDVAPHRDEFAVGVEELDAVGFPVDYIDVGVAVDGDVVGTDELARVDAGAAPRELVLAFAGVDVNAGVSIAVRHVDVAVPWVYGGRSGPVEGLSAPAGLWVVPVADLHQLIAGGAELLDGVYAIICAEQRVVMCDVQTVGPVVAEMSFSEGPDVVAVPVEHNDRFLAAGEDEHVVLGVDGDARTFFEGHAAG